VTSEGRVLTPEDAVQWATKCHECGDGVRLYGSEAEAREQYERDSAIEDERPADERHTIALLNRRMGWNTVTTTAWEGRRDR
jgi:hypothetical protein